MRFGDGRRLVAGDQLANRRLSTDLDFFAHTKHALRNYRKASSGILFCFCNFCVPMMGMRFCEEQARVGRVRCGEEAPPNVLHNDELRVGVLKSFLLRATHTYTTSYYLTRPWPWYNPPGEDTASSRRHQNPNVALRRALRQSSPSIASNSHVDGLVVFKRIMRPRSALPPQLCLSTSMSTMLIIQDTSSQRGVHGKKHVLHSDDPIVHPRWEHNDGLAYERCADG